MALALNLGPLRAGVEIAARADVGGTAAWRVELPSTALITRRGVRATCRRLMWQSVSMPTTLFLGAELLVRPSIVTQPDGTKKLDLTSTTIRTDMWEPWLIDAIVAAHEAAQAASKIPPAKARGDLEELGGSIAGELRATMRTVASCSFAFDALYASTKARAPEHPHQAAWKENRTRRRTQIAETFRHHLMLTDGEATQVGDLLGRMFSLRDAAVHPSAKFRPACYRDDLDAQVDWHHGTFRAAAAVTAVSETVAAFSILIGALSRATGELRAYAELASRILDPVCGLARRAGLCR